MTNKKHQQQKQDRIICVVTMWTFKLFRHEKTFAQHLHLVALVLPYIGKLCDSQKIQMIDNKYFICELCGKVFTPASNMHKHIVTTVVRNHCTMWLSIALEISKVLKSKGLVFAQF